MCGREVAELTGELCGAAVEESGAREGIIFLLTPFHRTQGMHPTANSVDFMRETCFNSAIRRGG